MFNFKVNIEYTQIFQGTIKDFYDFGLDIRGIVTLTCKIIDACYPI